MNNTYLNIIEIFLLLKKNKNIEIENFNPDNWNNALAAKNWSLIETSSSLDAMINNFNKLISDALDEVAPIKSFTIKSHYKFGLSGDTKEMMNVDINIVEKLKYRL